MEKDNIIKSYLKDIHTILNKDLYKKEHDKFNTMLVEKTAKYQQKFNFETNPRKGHSYWNVEADAFKHAFGSAYLALTKDNLRSIAAGYDHERDPNNPSGEKNMDLWNNQQGRRIAKQIKKEYGKNLNNLSQEQLDDIIADKIMQKMRKGELITHPSDERKHTGFAANIDNQHIYQTENGDSVHYSGKEPTKEELENLSIDDRLIYDGEINLANSKDDKAVDRYVKQYYNNEKYTKEELENNVKSGDVIYVESYTRSDGTEVKGYYRRK